MYVCVCERGRGRERGREGREGEGERVKREREGGRECESEGGQIFYLHLCAHYHKLFNFPVIQACGSQ